MKRICTHFSSGLTSSALLVLLFLFASAPASALGQTTCYFSVNVNDGSAGTVGFANASGTMSNDQNWASSEGGMPGSCTASGGVPGPEDTAVIEGSQYAEQDQAFEFAKLIFQNGSGISIDDRTILNLFGDTRYTLEVTGDVIVGNNVQFIRASNANSGDLIVGGNLYVGGESFTQGGSTVTPDGSNFIFQLFRNGNEGAVSVSGDMRFGTSSSSGLDLLLGGTATLLDGAGSMSSGPGSIDFENDSPVIEIAGDFTTRSATTFSRIGNAQLSLNGSSTQLIGGAIGSDFPSISVGATSDATFDLGVSTSTLEIADGGSVTLGSSGSLTLTDALTDNTTSGSGLDATTNSRTVTLSPSSNETLQVTGEIAFSTLNHNGAGTVNLNDLITVAGDLIAIGDITGEEVDLNGGATQQLQASNISLPNLVITDNAGTASTVQLDGNGGTLTLGALTIEGSSTFTAQYLDGNNNEINDPTGLTISGDVDVADGTLELSGGPSPAYLIAGNLTATTDGTFISNGRSLTLNGSTQEISGAISVDNLTVQNSSNVTVTSGGLDIAGDLDLQSGSFDTGGLLTVVSNRTSASGSNDGAIVSNGGTLISRAGDRVERFISEATSEDTGGPGSGSSDDVGEPSNDELGDDAGFRLLAHPFADNIPARELKRISNGTNYTQGDPNPGEDDSIIDPLPDAGGSPGNLGNSMIFRFDSGSQSFSSEDESGSNNTDRNFQMEQGKGYLVFFFDDEEDPIDNDGSGTPGLRFDAGGSQPLTDLSGSAPSVTLPDAIGFHLVGNPYPAGYDVSQMQVNGTDIGSNSNFSNALTRVIAVDGGNTEETFGPGGTEGNIASSWQGFYIEQTASTGGDITVSFPPAGVVGGSSNDEIFFGAQPEAATHPRANLRLRKRVNPGSSLPAFSTQDNAELVLRDDASTGRDAYDSGKITLPTAAVSRNGNPIGLETALLAFSRSDGTTYLKRDARPIPASSDDYPIVYDVAFDCANLDSDATYMIDIDEAEGINPNWNVELRDTHTGDESVLYTGGSTDQSYSFSVAATQCGSTVGSNASPTASSLAYDGSLTGGNATTGSRFQLFIGPPDTIPVELEGLNGSVDGQDVLLEWTTRSETNNAGFQIQQERDDAFIDMQNAFVEGAGTTDEPQSYSFRVEDLAPGTHTFRLKQVDVDGTSRVTDPVEVEVGLAGQYQLSTYPNPIQDRATVEFSVKETQPVTIELYNTLGQRVRTIYQGTARAEEAIRQTLDGSDLSSGLYIVRLRGEGFTATRKITVVR